MNEPETEFFAQPPPIPPAQESLPVYFAVSIPKLLIMSFCTLSLYQFYWFYKNWAMVQRREASRISPWLRATFNVFFCYPLFLRIQRTAEQEGVGASFPAGLLAFGWILLEVLPSLPDPYWVFAYGLPLLLIPPQVAANRINAKIVPGHDRNGRFSNGNLIGVAVGSVLLIAFLFWMRFFV